MKTLLETRFLVDPDGLADLCDALTTRFSPAQARETLYRFERLKPAANGIRNLTRILCFNRGSISPR